MNTMSQEHDLDELVNWESIDLLEENQTQFVASEALGISQSIISRL